MPGTKTVGELFEKLNNILKIKAANDVELDILRLIKSTTHMSTIHDGKTLLDIAIEKKCPSMIIKLLISQGIKTNYQYTLHSAVKNNDTDVVKILLENSEHIKLDLNNEDEKGFTALDYVKHNSQMYTLLEKYGAKHSSEKHKHRSTLDISIENFDEKRIKTDGKYCFGILEKALDISYKKEFEFEEAIKYFVEQGYFDALNTKKEGLIIPKQSHFNILEKALEIKDKTLRKKVIGYLVTQGANIDCKGSNGKTLLEESVQSYDNKNELEKLELLLKLGARAISNTTSWEHICCYPSSYSSTIKLIIKYFKHPEINDLLPGIVKISNVNLFKESLKNNADIVKLKDHNGDTLLHLAIKNNCKPEIVEALLSNGANPYLKNNGGLTALELLIQDNKSDLKIAELLVKKMVEIASSDESKASQLKSIIDTSSDGESKTLLERALLQRNDNLVRLLVLAGERKGIDIKDKNGKTIIERSIVSNDPLIQFWYSDCEDFICKLIDDTLKTRRTQVLQELVKHEALKDKIREKITPDYLKKVKSEDQSHQFVELLVKSGIVVDANHQINPESSAQGATLSAKNKEGRTPIDEANQPNLSSYQSCFKGHKRSELLNHLLIGLGATFCATAVIAAFAPLAMEVLYAAAVVAVIGIVCTAYKVYGVNEKIEARLNEPTATQNLSDSVNLGNSGLFRQ